MLEAVDHDQLFVDEAGDPVLFNKRGAVMQALMGSIRHAAGWDENAPYDPAAKTTITTVYADHPHESAGLQIADYYLWAVQRLFERGEDRFFNLIASDYRLIMDLDDQRNQPTGEQYNKNHPLRLEKLKPVAG